MKQTISVLITLCLASLTVCLLTVAAIGAQTKKSSARVSTNKPTESEVRALAERLGRAQADLIAASKEYKRSLEKLLPWEEDERKRAAAEVEVRKQLLAEGVASKRDLEDSERKLTNAEAKVAQTRKQLGEADELIAAAAAEAAIDPMIQARKLLAQERKRERTEKGRVYYVRFIIVGEIAIYDYSGAVSGQVIKHRQRIKVDSRRYY
jgi:DNA repair exonuclease SbcCD ATPase subunit